MKYVYNNCEGLFVYKTFKQEDFSKSAEDENSSFCQNTYEVYDLLNNLKAMTNGVCLPPAKEKTVVLQI